MRSVNLWTNQYKDRISRNGSVHDNRGIRTVYGVVMDGVYIKSFGGLNVAKAFVNSKRKEKSKWTESID